MKKLIPLSLICLVSVNSIAQNSNVVFFTDNGERFHIVLNGQNQNLQPQTNVRVDNLTAMDYKLKVIFENENIKILERPLRIKPYTETTIQLNEKEKTTGGIKSIKKFNAKLNKEFGMNDTVPSETKELYGLRLISETPLGTPPAPQHYSGSTQQTQGGTTMQGTATTTTTTTQATTVSGTTTSSTATTNAPSGQSNISMNVNINTGGTGHSETQYQETHTTTVTSTGGTAVTSEHYVMPGYSGPIGCPWPMSDNDFNRAKQSIESKSFEDSKLTIAKQVINTNCLFSRHVREIMVLFSFEDTKLDLAKYAYGYTFDLGNYYLVNDAFDFESSIDELNAYINNR